MPIVTTVRPSCLDSTTRVRADNHACGSVAEATLLSCHARRAEPAAGDTHEAQVTAQQGGTRCKGVTLRGPPRAQAVVALVAAKQRQDHRPGGPEPQHDGMRRLLPAPRSSASVVRNP